ncbi:hypothetical protein [Streptomyces daliensis]
MTGTPIVRDGWDDPRKPVGTGPFRFASCTAGRSFTGRRFDDRRTVLEQVARTAVQLRGLTAREAERQARHLWERLGLTSEHTTRHAAALSSGELQRAAPSRP